MIIYKIILFIANFSSMRKFRRWRSTVNSCAGVVLIVMNNLALQWTEINVTCETNSTESMWYSTWQSSGCRSQASFVISGHVAACRWTAPQVKPITGEIMRRMQCTCNAGAQHNVFLPRDAMQAVCVCMCLFVCLSRSYFLSKRIKISSKFFSPPHSHTILVLSHQTA